MSEPSDTPAAPAQTMIDWLTDLAAEGMMDVIDVLAERARGGQSPVRCEMLWPRKVVTPGAGAEAYAENPKQKTGMFGR